VAALRVLGFAARDRSASPPRWRLSQSLGERGGPRVRRLPQVGAGAAHHPAAPRRSPALGLSPAGAKVRRSPRRVGSAAGDVGRALELSAPGGRAQRAHRSDVEQPGVARWVRGPAPLGGARDRLRDAAPDRFRAAVTQPLRSFGRPHGAPPRGPRAARHVARAPRARALRSGAGRAGRVGARLVAGDAHRSSARRLHAGPALQLAGVARSREHAVVRLGRASSDASPSATGHSTSRCCRSAATSPVGSCSRCT